MKPAIKNRKGKEFKIIGLSRKVKRVEPTIDYIALARQLGTALKDKFEEYRKMHMRAWAEARNRWLD